MSTGPCDLSEARQQVQRQDREGASPEGARSYVNEFGEVLALCPVPHL